MKRSHNPYNLFPIKPGDKFTGIYFTGIASVVSVANDIAVMQFHDAKESHRTGEEWSIPTIEEEIRILDLHRLISYQFRRLSSERSFTRGFGFWEDMSDQYCWHFIVQFLPNFEHRNDVMTSDDLSCVVGGEKSLQWLYNNYPEWNGLSLSEIKDIHYHWDCTLKMKAQAAFAQLLKSGKIEVREFPVSIVSARIQGDNNSDKVWLQCADETTSKFGHEFHVPSAELQKVLSRWVNEGTNEQQFQIYYAHNNSGEEYWCNAKSIDFIEN